MIIIIVFFLVLVLFFLTLVLMGIPILSFGKNKNAKKSWSVWDSICLFFGSVDYDRALRFRQKRKDDQDKRNTKLKKLSNSIINDADLAESVVKKIITNAIIEEKNNPHLGFILREPYVGPTYYSFPVSMVFLIVEKLGHGVACNSFSYTVTDDQDIYLDLFNPVLSHKDLDQIDTETVATVGKNKFIAIYKTP